VGLGGHQDLDDYCDMPVVCVPCPLDVLCVILFFGLLSTGGATIGLFIISCGLRAGERERGR